MKKTKKITALLVCTALLFCSTVSAGALDYTPESFVYFEQTVDEHGGLAYIELQTSHYMYEFNFTAAYFGTELVEKLEYKYVEPNDFEKEFLNIKQARLVRLYLKQPVIYCAEELILNVLPQKNLGGSCFAFMNDGYSIDVDAANLSVNSLFSKGEYRPTINLNDSLGYVSKNMLRNPYYQLNYNILLERCVTVYRMNADKLDVEKYIDTYVSFFLQPGDNVTLLFKDDGAEPLFPTDIRNMQICKKYFSEEDIYYVGDHTQTAVVAVTDENIDKFSKIKELEFIGDAFFGAAAQPEISSGKMLLGDVDHSGRGVDGRITAADARCILRYCAGLEAPKLTKQFFFCADANHDNKISAADARAVLRMAAKVGLGYEMVFDNESGWVDSF